MRFHRVIISCVSPSPLRPPGRHIPAARPGYVFASRPRSASASRRRRGRARRWRGKARRRTQRRGRAVEDGRGRDGVGDPRRLAKAFSLTILAATHTEYPYTYAVSDGQATIIGFDRAYPGALLSIPYELGGSYPVVAIGDHAFTNCPSLASVTVPFTVTSIGKAAFRDCAALADAAILGGAAVGAEAFYNCTALTNVALPPAPLVGIGDYAFYNCTALGAIDIPEGFNTIGFSAFYNCTALASVTLPDYLMDIGDYAFYGCTALGAIVIPESVSMIGNYAFAECGRLAGAYFCGDAPFENFDMFENVSGAMTVYRLYEKTGWPDDPLPWAGRPTALWGGAVLSVTPGSRSVTKEAGTTTFSVANKGPGVMSWAAEVAAGGDWARISGGGAGTVTVGFDANPPGGAARTATIRVTAAEAIGSPAEVTVVQAAHPLPPEITTPGPLPAGTIGTAYSLALAAGGGTAPYAWALESGGLPAGLGLGGDGVISGTPTASGTFNFEIRVEGGDGLSSTKAFSLTVKPAGGGYLCDPEGDAALRTAGTYDGYFYAAERFGKAGEASAVRGTLFLKVTSLVGKLTAKATLQGGSVSFKGAAWSAAEADGTQRAELTVSGGEKLVLFVRQNRIWGTLAGGKAGAAPLALDGARNRFADRSDTEAAARLGTFMGYYTVALPPAGDGAGAAPQGAGYLTLTVRAKGAVKVAGILADGTKVSRSSRLVLFDGCGPEACVPLFAPLYAKKGWAGGLLWIDPKTRVMETDRGLGWFIRWENPGRAGPDGFSLLLEACGCFYGTGAPLAAAYRFGAETNGTAYFDAGAPRAWAAPPEAPVAGAGNRLTVAKGAKPKKVGEGGAARYAYDVANPAGVKFSFAPRTGIFKGKFSLYCDYEDAGKQLIHKAATVPYAGVLAPVRGEAFGALPAGLGYCLIPDNDPAAKALRLKHSRLVWLEESK